MSTNKAIALIAIALSGCGSSQYPITINAPTNGSTTNTTQTNNQNNNQTTYQKPELEQQNRTTNAQGNLFIVEGIGSTYIDEYDTTIGIGDVDITNGAADIRITFPNGDNISEPRTKPGRTWTFKLNDIEYRLKLASINVLNHSAKFKIEKK